jgi:SAM-dependent methyltransferase
MTPETSDQPSVQPSDQDAINRRVYHARSVVRSYTRDGLDRAETMALLAHQPAFAGGRVLDLGIGTGRTTRFIAPLAGRYLGVDYSPVMVEHVRRELPHVDCRIADMRDLGDLDRGSFDCVFGFCNLLDAVSHEDRLVVLAEVRRVLRLDGLFMFSAHNRRYRHAESGPSLARSLNPITQLMHVAKLARRLNNHWRVRRHRRFESGYALLNDVGHDYAVLHYYIDRATQQHQLEEAGYTLVAAYARDGRLLGPGDSDDDSPDILYVARSLSGKGSAT